MELLIDELLLFSEEIDSAESWVSLGDVIEKKFLCQVDCLCVGSCGGAISVDFFDAVEWGR